jgi:hypothetical protein
MPGSCPQWTPLLPLLLVLAYDGRFEGPKSAVKVAGGTHGPQLMSVSTPAALPAGPHG